MTGMEYGRGKTMAISGDTLAALKHLADDGPPALSMVEINLCLSYYCWFWVENGYDTNAIGTAYSAMFSLFKEVERRAPDAFVADELWRAALTASFKEVVVPPATRERMS